MKGAKINMKELNNMSKEIARIKEILIDQIEGYFRDGNDEIEVSDTNTVINDNEELVMIAKNCITTAYDLVQFDYDYSDLSINDLSTIIEIINQNIFERYQN